MARKDLEARYSKASVVGGILVALVGGAHLTAWLVGSMAQLGEASVTMKANAALALLLAGLAVVMQRFGGRVWRWVGRFSAGIVLLIGAGTLAEHASGWDAGIDELLATEPAGALGTSMPNRMGTPAALCLVLSGVALLLVNSKGERAAGVGQKFSLAVCLVGLLGVIGYAYDARSLYAIERLTATAWPTAATLLVLGVSLLFARPDGGLMRVATADDAGGVALRRLLVPTVGYPLVLGWLLLWGVRRGFYDTALGTSLLVVILATFVSIIVYYTARGLSRAAQAEHAAARRLRTFFESDMMGTIYWNMDGQILDANNKFLRMVGYDRGDLKSGRVHWADMTPAEYDKMDERAMQELRKTGVDTPYEKEFIRKDGSRIPVIIGAAMLDERRYEGVAFVLDVTERKRARDALREREEHARRIIDNTLSFVSVLARDGTVIEVNATALRAGGLTREDVMHKKFWDCYWWSYDPAVQEQLREAIARALRGEVVRYDVTVRMANEKRMPIDFMLAPVRNEAGEITHLIPSGMDITERKRVEKALRKAQTALRQHADNLEKTVEERTASLREAVGELEHFSYTITHDMRAPLRAMKGFATLAMQLGAGGEAEEQKAFLNRISTAAERMDALITDALNYSKAGRQELPLGDVDLQALLQGMLESYPEFHASGARIHLEPGIPVVTGNGAGLTQCFSNLIGNAVKFVREGETAEVRIRSELRDGWVRIWVEDKGIGIDEGMLPRVFDMFTREHSNYPGTGIGLALVRKVVQRMGGRVGVESQLNAGSRFWVDLRPGRGSEGHSFAA